MPANPCRLGVYFRNAFFYCFSRARSLLVGRSSVGGFERLAAMGCKLCCGLARLAKHGFAGLHAYQFVLVCAGGNRCGQYRRRERGGRYFV